MRLSLLLLLMVFFVPVNAQEEKVIENQISFYLNKIEPSVNDFESLDSANSGLMAYLKLIAGKPATLEYSFDGLKDKEIQILTSDDRKFRIFCWDTQGGGTMRYYNVLIQYKTHSGSDYKVINDVSGADPTDPGSWYQELHTIKAESDRTYYLATSISTLWSGYTVGHIEAYTIDEGKLNESIQLFQTPKAAYNSISVEYNWIHNKNNDAFNDNNIHLSDDKQKLYIPLVTNKGFVTDKSLVYKFDGYKFVYDKTTH